jgi:hypothetical protein
LLCGPCSRSYRLHEKPDTGGAPLFMTENRQFHSFIMITMILNARHDSVIAGRSFWECFRRRGSLVR